MHHIKHLTWWQSSGNILKVGICHYEMNEYLTLVLTQVFSKGFLFLSLGNWYRPIVQYIANLILLTCSDVLQYFYARAFDYFLSWGNIYTILGNFYHVWIRDQRVWSDQSHLHGSLWFESMPVCSCMLNVFCFPHFQHTPQWNLTCSCPCSIRWVHIPRQLTWVRAQADASFLVIFSYQLSYWLLS